MVTLFIRISKRHFTKCADGKRNKLREKRLDFRGQRNIFFLQMVAIFVKYDSLSRRMDRDDHSHSPCKKRFAKNMFQYNALNYSVRIQFWIITHNRRRNRRRSHRRNHLRSHNPWIKEIQIINFKMVNLKKKKKTWKKNMKCIF